MKTIPFNTAPYLARLGDNPTAGLVPMAQDTRDMVEDYYTNPQVHRALETLFISTKTTRDDPETTLWGGFFEFLFITFLIEKGVVIHITDPEIVSRLHESRLPGPLTLDDIHLPFPACEFRFGHGPAVIVIDFAHQAFRDYYSRHMPVQVAAVERGDVLIGMGAHDPVGSNHFLAGKFCNRTTPLLEQLRDVNRTYATPRELEVLQSQLTSSVFALMLAAERVQVPTRIHGLTPPAARLDKRRKHYRCLQPLFTFPRKGTEPAGVLEPGQQPREVTPHFRRAHYRVLLDKRYQRNEHGKPRIVSVQASAIHGGMHGQRRI